MAETHEMYGTKMIHQELFGENSSIGLMNSLIGSLSEVVFPVDYLIFHLVSKLLYCCCCESGVSGLALEFVAETHETHEMEMIHQEFDNNNLIGLMNNPIEPLSEFLFSVYFLYYFSFSF